MTDFDLANSRSTLSKTLGWAVYLACSWTWCIGMFLPVLLVRDYGVWGWVVFAVPNVIGAALMGWVIRNREQSERIVRDNATACQGFSIVTIAFQFFFALWMISRIAGTPGMLCTAIVFLLIYLLGWKRFSNDIWIAIGVYACSLFALFRMGITHQLAWPATHHANLTDLLALAPVCAFGFLLCPYLDLTFHRAARDTDDRSRRWAFGLGFGLLFFLMIAFTMLYAGQLIPAIDAPIRGISVLLIAHLVLQLSFTSAIHFRELSGDNWMAKIAIGVLLVCLIIGRALPHFRFGNLDGGEFIYRLLMAFYGLVFPAYVWLCMIPTSDASTKMIRRKHVVFCVSVLLAAPMYWMGFIEQKMMWLVPGLAVVLLARLALMRAASASALMVVHQESSNAQL